MSLIIPANTLASGGFAVDNSCRFNSGSSDDLTKNFSETQDSRRKFTVSSWIKRSKLSDGDQRIWGSSEGSGEGYNSFGWNGSDKLKVLSGNTSNSGTQLNFESNQVFRDVSAWSHLVYAVDTTQGTESNRVKIYHNGTQITSWGTATYPSQNTDLLTSTTPQMTIGMRDLRGTDANFYSGYISEFVFIDNQQLDPTSFGEFDEDSGIWKPIDVSGLTFGTNGFYLDFEDSGALGADVSGNTNNFTVNNLTAIDQTTDTPTLNFCTMNPLVASSSIAFSNGNNTITGSNADNNDANNIATIGVSSGKWYWEVKYSTAASSTSSTVGIATLENYKSNVNNTTETGFVVVRFDGGMRVDGSVTGTGYWSSNPVAGDIIMFALDMDNGKFYLGLNGTWQNSGDPESGATGTGSLTTSRSGTQTFCTRYLNSVFEANFGNAPYTISSGNTDANGIGNFEYAPPSGYLSLCTANISEVLG